MPEPQNNYRSIEVLTLTIDASSVLKLTDEERYVYYMLGHIFNELMCLQKLLFFTMPTHDDGRPLRMQPEIAQAFFMFRIAAGKIWEAKLAFDEKRMSTVLRDSFFPLVSDGRDRQKSLNGLIQKGSWLKNLRNVHAFHYPSADEWSPLVQKSEGWTDDDIFLSSQSGNTFYAGSEATAQAWMFGALNRADPNIAIDPMISKLIEALSKFNGIIEDVLQAFIEKRLVSKNKGQADSGEVSTPEFKSFRVPFWTYMPESKDM